MLAELVDHVIGIDPDRDWITAAVLDSKTTGVVATAKFAADNDGYDEAIEWADTHTEAGDRSWVVEGSGSYGRGLTAALSRVGEWVIEFDRPHQRSTKDGAKTDELDAVRAAREALGRHKLHTPRTHDGHREALRVHTITREGVVRARTAAINELKALVLTSPEELRSELRGLTTTALIKRCAAFRTATSRPVAEQCVRNTMRVVARRIQNFNDEIEVHDVAMKQLVDEAAPQLVAQPGVGYVTAAMFIIAWSHPGRCRSEAAYARLAGVAPLTANSGQSQDRHRLNRYGDRKLNRACHMVALARWQYHEPTKAYIARRRAEGRTDREIRRCLKRYIARNVWRQLEHQNPRITA